MDLIGNLAYGFEVVSTPTNLLLCFAGALLGTLVGVLPGIGPLATVSLLLPITFGLEPLGGLIMLAGIYYGAQYGGSTTSILVNLPGESSSVVTCLDGHQMALQGKAGVALSTAALSSFFAGTVATLIIAVFSPVLAAVALDFRPPDYFALMLFGLVASVALAQGAPVKAVAMVFLGLLLGIIGIDVNSGVPRYTFGFIQLEDGMDFAVLAMGLFGISEIVAQLGRTSERHEVLRIGGLRPNRQELRAIVLPSLRGTAIGSVLGVLPGGGALLSAFAAYVVEKKLAKDPSRFGRGAIEGVAAPEAANNAGAQTSFIPLLTLGIPGNALIALLIGAMMIHGVVPGPDIIQKHPDIFWGLIVSMWIGNLMLVIINLPLVGLWVSMLRIPYRYLYPAIILICTIGAFGIRNSVFDIFLLAFFGIIGSIFVRLRCEPTPLILGFVLGPMMEEYLRRSLLLSDGNWMTFVDHRIGLFFLVASGALATLMVIPNIRKQREAVFREE